MADKNQRLVLSILDFLSQAIRDGTVKSDDQEGLEVAIQCIGEAFGVDPTDEQQRQRFSIQPATLTSIFDVYLKTRDKLGTGGTSIGGTNASSPNTAPFSPPSVSSEDKIKAEKLKQSGNAQMSGKQYTEAIASYTAAISLDSTNPVYYSNRAAAHSTLEDHYSAIEDAQKALEVDPSFTKAYSRMGHAHYCLEQYEEASHAFDKGLALDPTNTNLKTGSENSRAKLLASVASNTTATSAPSRGGGPDLASMMSGLMGSGGGGRGGGMPDMASMLNNPQMMAMAQQMMAHGGMERLMSNPTIQNMVNRAQSGGDMPSMAEMMSDPSIRELACQFGTGAGRPGSEGV